MAAVQQSDGFVNIDGSLLEGGGQVLRIAISLSAIKHIPVRIFNIRAGRSKPGLAEQHLKGLLLVRDMCNGKLRGAEIGSTEVSFSPGLMRCGHFESRVKTAGSVALLMQIAVPCALFAPGPCNLLLWGGTDAEMAPSIDYIGKAVAVHAQYDTDTFLDTLSKKVTANIFKLFGAHFSVNIIKRGFFPRGGGKVHVEVQNAKGGLTPVNLTSPGVVTKIHGTAVAGGTCPVRVGHEMKKAAENVLLERFGSQTQPNISVLQGPADCPGSSITVLAETSTGCVLGTCAIGSRPKKPQSVGAGVALELLEAKPGQFCVDSHAQDQVILPMALSKGISKVLSGPMTLHTKTAIAIVEMLTKAKFEVQEQDSTSIIIMCTGDP